MTQKFSNQTELTVTLLDKSTCYTIEIKSGLFNDIHEFAQDLTSLGSKFAIITNTTIARMYGDELTDSLSTHGLNTSLFSFPDGENFKTRQTKDSLEDQLLEKGFGRDTCVIALGGGIATDVAGFVAATYCRGIPYIIIPTSLLGMVDACIGGKTGVNTPHGKNLIGCIYQPKKILIDPYLLKTLPLKEIKNGVVEIIKHGLIADHTLFEYLEIHSEQLLTLQPTVLEKVIFESCRIKKEIIEHDEKETGKRRLLNFGHTIGHALETLMGYSISHGEAVAIGLLVESYIALQLGHLSQHSFDKIKKILNTYSIPLHLPYKIPIDTFIKTMQLDKKSLKGKPRFIIINDIGVPLEYNDTYCTHVDESLIKNALLWMHHALCSH